VDASRKGLAAGRSAGRRLRMRRCCVPRLRIGSHFGTAGAGADHRPRGRRTCLLICRRRSRRRCRQGLRFCLPRRPAEIRLQRRESSPLPALGLGRRFAAESNPSRATLGSSGRAPRSPLEDLPLSSPEVQAATPSRSLRAIDRSTTELQTRLRRHDCPPRQLWASGVSANRSKNVPGTETVGGQKAEGKIKGLLRLRRN
jgi:hypothetical protein